MGKLTGIYRPFRKMTEEQIEKWSGSLVNLVGSVVKDESTKVKAYVDRHRNNHPGYSKETLARHIIKRRALKAGVLGGMCSIGGLITLPVTMSVNLYYLFRIQAKMVLAISHLYGWDTDDVETQSDLILVMGGAGSTKALAGIGIKIGEAFTIKVFRKYITGEVMSQVNKVISKKSLPLLERKVC